MHILLVLLLSYHLLLVLFTFGDFILLRPLLISTNYNQTIILQAGQFQKCSSLLTIIIWLLSKSLLDCSSNIQYIIMNPSRSSYLFIYPWHCCIVGRVQDMLSTSPTKGPYFGWLLINLDINSIFIYLFDSSANQTNIYLLNLVNSNCHSCHMVLVIVFYFSEYVCVHFTKHDKSKFLGYRCSHLKKFFESQSSTEDQ